MVAKKTSITHCETKPWLQFYPLGAGTTPPPLARKGFGGCLGGVSKPNPLENYTLPQMRIQGTGKKEVSRAV